MVSKKVSESSYEMADWMMFELGLDIEASFIYAIIYDFSKTGKACPYDIQLISSNSNIKPAKVEKFIMKMLKNGVIESVVSDAGEIVGLVHSKDYLRGRGIEVG